MIPGNLAGFKPGAGYARGYWAAALIADYVGEDRGFLPKGVPNPAKPGEVTADFSPPAMFVTPTTPDRLYLPQALTDFGRRIEAMDTLWVQYLSSSSIALGGGKHDIEDEHAIPVFRVNELGSARFWDHLPDYNNYVKQLNCIAARFAVENEFSTATEVPAYNKCPLWQIRSD